MKTRKSGICAGVFGGITLACLLLPSIDAAPVLLANYLMNGDANDATSNCPPMQLYNASFVSNAMFIPAIPGHDHRTSAYIKSFSYDAFTVAVDFKPTSMAPPWGEAILYGGFWYRWMGFDRVDDRLRITLNNHSLAFDFPEARISTNQWHRLVCSFDGSGQRIVTFLDGVHLADIQLQNFHFEVVGTKDEVQEKELTFTDPSIASYFSGFVDNLKIFGQALTPAEITSLLFPRVDCVRSGSTMLLHWPVAEMDGFILESTPAFSITNVWSPVLPAPVVISDRYVVPQEIGGPARFFRLRK